LYPSSSRSLPIAAVPSIWKRFTPPVLATGLNVSVEEEGCDQRAALSCGCGQGLAEILIAARSPDSRRSSALAAALGAVVAAVIRWAVSFSANAVR
jgi:hypothetical protein